MNKSCALFQDEPLAGSAMDSQRWLLWEHAGPYPAKLDQLTDESYSTVKNLAAELDASLLLIRKFQHGKSHLYREKHLMRIFYSNGIDLYTLEVDRVDPTLTATVMQNASISLEPIFLVCTNAKRDRCCAIFGRALLTELSKATDYESYLWECSHFGGHRFAPMILVLPSGYCYGRLNFTLAQEVISHALAHKVFPQNLRGRCGLTQMEQITDIAVRELSGALPIDAVKISINGDIIAQAVAQAIVLDGLGKTHNYCVSFTEQNFPARPTSCGDEWKSGSTLVVDKLESMT